MKIRSLVLCALLAALTAVLSQLSIPLPGMVPINLAMLSVCLCGALLGAKLGIISQLVYLCLGLVGIPVFAGFRGGLSVLAGPTGGYLIGYAVAAFLIGWILQQKPSKPMLPIAMAVGLLACYTLGTAWYMLSTSTALVPALTACVLPFLPGDVVKIVVACLVAARLGILRYATPTQTT